MKKKLKKKIRILFIALFVLLYLFNLAIVLTLNDTFPETNANNKSIEIIFELIRTFIITAIEFIPVILIKVGVKSGTKAAKKEIMSEIDFSKDKGWYREILKDYSPAELSYIDDFTINPINDIAATLLSLKLKKKIELKDDKIEILDSNNDGLKETEKFVLKRIQNGKVMIDSIEAFSEVAKVEAIIHKTIEEEKDKVIKISKKVIKSFITVFVLPFIMSWIFEIGELFGDYELVIVTLAMITIVIIGIISISKIVYIPYLISYMISKINSFERTEKGEEINIKIEGLKNYIKNYTLLAEKEKNDLVVWEEYLIYSVLFDLNKQLTKDLSKLITIKEN